MRSCEKKYESKREKSYTQNSRSALKSLLRDNLDDFADGVINEVWAFGYLPEKKPLAHRATTAELRGTAGSGYKDSSDKVKGWHTPRAKTKRNESRGRRLEVDSGR